MVCRRIGATSITGETNWYTSFISARCPPALKADKRGECLDTVAGDLLEYPARTEQPF